MHTFYINLWTNVVFHNKTPDFNQGLTPQVGLSQFNQHQTSTGFPQGLENRGKINSQGIVGEFYCGPKVRDFIHFRPKVKLQ